MTTVTINTDASWYPIQKWGSYAYWIKGENLFLSGYGVFKDVCEGATHAEQKSLCNALHILEMSGYKPEKIYINRDNIHAKGGRNGNYVQKMISATIKRIKRKSIPPHHPNYVGTNYVEYRHVKAHKHTNNSRHWVNDWCDKMCKKALRDHRLKIENSTKK